MNDAPLTVTEDYFTAIVERRLDDLLDLYVKSDRTLVFDEGPRWSFLGYDQVATSWRELFDGGPRFRACRWAETPACDADGDLAWVAGTIDLQLAVGDLAKQAHVRGTFVLRRVDGRWLIAHEHFSQPSDDPHSRGQWLSPEH